MNEGGILTTNLLKRIEQPITSQDYLKGYGQELINFHQWQEKGSIESNKAKHAGDSLAMKQEPIFLDDAWSHAMERDEFAQGLANK